MRQQALIGGASERDARSGISRIRGIQFCCSCTRFHCCETNKNSLLRAQRELRKPCVASALIRLESIIRRAVTWTTHTLQEYDCCDYSGSGIFSWLLLVYSGRSWVSHAVVVHNNWHQYARLHPSCSLSKVQPLISVAASKIVKIIGCIPRRWNYDL